jgi:tetratricopeptide (TPR) repeat protein
MTKFIRRATLAALFSTASAFAFTAIAPIHPAEAAANAPAKKEDEGPKVRAAVGKGLNDAMKAIDAKDFGTALAKVKEVDAAIKDKSPFEEYQVAKYLGFIAINQVPMPDYAAAAAAYNREIASGGAPEAEKAGMYNVAMRLNYQSMDFADVIKDAAELQKMQPLDDTGYLVLIQSYFNTSDFANAAETSKKEIAAKVAAGGKPSEDVLGLLLNAQIKNKNEAGAREALDQLAMISAKPEAWGQVIDFTLGAQGINDHQLLNAYRLSMLTGTMKDTDYAAMATIDLQNGLPKEAIAALTKAMKTGELMDQANQLAKRDDINALAAEAVKQTNNGEVDVKLGESYYTYGQYDKAVEALQKGIQKGGLKDPADAQTTLGIAYLAAGQKDKATEAFEAAAKNQGAAGQVAHAWSLYSRRVSGA